uniref:ATPase inhibitor n=1 Tax=Knipowitschia caucasica TaxID=637954 RepID=A0AAV2KJ04_KNICA
MNIDYRSKRAEASRREVLFGRSKAAVRRTTEEVCTGLNIGATLTEEEQSYRDALRKIQEQQELRQKEKEEVQRYEAQLEEEMRRHQAWGRGEGGAPLKDSTG